MTSTSQSIRRRLSLLRLAEELGNVSTACKLTGYHRDTFYEVIDEHRVSFVDSPAAIRFSPPIKLRPDQPRGSTCQAAEFAA